MWNAWDEHASTNALIHDLLAHSAAVESSAVVEEPVAEPDAEPEDTDEEPDQGSRVHNNFETWLQATGHTAPPQLVALYKDQKTFQRLVRKWPTDLGRMVLGEVERNPPIHAGICTSPDPQQAYLYLALPDWSLGSRIQTDLLGFLVLWHLAKHADVQAHAKHACGHQAQLIVTWCTHKYRMDEDGERQEAKGSGSRTHFYLAATRPPPRAAEPDVEPQSRLRGLSLAQIYHTTMWFEGTYPDNGGPCLSSRLLLRWSNQAPLNMFHLASDIWRNLPSQTGV